MTTKMEALVTLC